MAVDDHLLVGGRRRRLDGGDERRSDIAQVRAQRARRSDRVAVADRARQRDRAVEPFADLLHQRERRQRAGMAARARRHRDQAVGTLLDRLPGERVVDDVVEDDPAIAVDRLVDVGPRAERGDDDGHLVLDAQRHILLEPGVGPVDDEVDRERRVLVGQFGGQPLQPLLEHARGPRVERRERTDHARAALREHQLGLRDDEQRRGDHRDRQAILEQRGHRHGSGVLGPEWVASFEAVMDTRIIVARRVG